MGYSVGVRARSAKLQQEMLSFLETNFRSWSEVRGKKRKFDRVSEPTDAPSYDRGPHVVGFDHSCALGWERFYTFTTCRWIALQVGRRRRSFSKDAVTPNLFPTPTPFITYDGYENWPVVVSTASEARLRPVGQRWCCYDALGLPIGPDRYKDNAHLAAEEVLTMSEFEPAWKAMVKEQDAAKLGKIPDMGKRRDIHRRIMSKHMKPFVEEGFQLVRQEMQRLDRLYRERQ